MSPAAIVSPTPAPTPATFSKSPVVSSSTKPIITTSNTMPHQTGPSFPSDSSIPAWVQPDLTRLLRVEHLPGSFMSRAVSLVDLPAGAIFARITTPTPAVCAYSSVQASPDLHIELNSDLIYINHSCRPTLVFDMKKWEVRVDDKLEGGLKKGDELTFFYPSTEWDMAQPFDCRCGEDVCKGRISGAKDMNEAVLEKYSLNQHIVELLEQRKRANA